MPRSLAERREYQKNYFRENRKWFIEYKATLACNRCGFSHPAAMQFHHLRDKTMAISKMVSLQWKKAIIMAEIAKCEILCANCHFILHYEEGNKGGKPRGLKPKATTGYERLI